MTLQNCLPCPAAFILFETSAEVRGEEEAYTNNRGSAVRKGARGPNVLQIFFVFLSGRRNNLTLSDQPHVTLQLAVFAI
jgi:hypothetical protein